MMTIDNLYQKCLQRKLFITKKSGQNEPGAEKDPPKNFDDMALSGDNSLVQLFIIKNCIENFFRLKKTLDTKQHIAVQKQKMRDNNEIV